MRLLAAGLAMWMAQSSVRMGLPVEGLALADLHRTFNEVHSGHAHEAIDIMAPRGTPVLSADSGRVFRLRRNPAGGITVYALDPEEQFIYYYAHLERYREGLAEGTVLAQGDVLGYVGTTGNAPPNTPHLHFQMMRYRGDGKYFQERGEMVVQVRWFNVRPWYMKSVPYSADTTVTEYYNLLAEPTGTEWFVVTTVVHDPVNLAVDYITSTNFRKEPDNSKFKPEPCTLR